MSVDAANLSQEFIDRRAGDAEVSLDRFERRQFANSYAELSPEARHLAEAIDRYKFRHRRRFINYEEMLSVIKDLGYRKGAPNLASAEPVGEAAVSLHAPTSS